MKGLIVLIAGGASERILIEPKEGETYVVLEMSEACPIGEKVPVRGRLYFLDAEIKLGTLLVKHKFEMSSISELWVLNKTLEHGASIEKPITVFLAPGEHDGLKWSGNAG